MNWLRFLGTQIVTAWQLWSTAVRIGFLWTLLWGLGLVTSPIFGTRFIDSQFNFLNGTAKIVMGVYLLFLSVTALIFPMRGAFCATIVIAGLRLLDAFAPFNIYGVIFWLMILAFMLIEEGGPHIRQLHRGRVASYVQSVADEESAIQSNNPPSG